MEKRKYILESSIDRKKWQHRATFYEGDDSRFGKPFSDDIALLEARSFKEYWTKRERSYDDNLLRVINERKYVRIIIEI